MARKLPAILFLLIFTPVFAESIASTNTSWYLFLSPKVLIFMVLLYGVAALLLRELWVRGRVSFGSLLLYGAMFAGLNEGIVANTWFKLNPLTFSGTELARAAGTNWHMVANLIIYHTLFSMLIPLVLSFIAFPRLKEVPLLTRRGMAVCAGLLLFVAVASLAPRHRVLVADVGQRVVLLLVLIVAAIFSLGTHLRPFRAKTVKKYSSESLFGIGAAFTVLFGLSYFVLPKMVPGWSLLFTLLLYGGGIIMARRIATIATSDIYQVLPLFAGLMVPLFITSFSKIVILQPLVIALYVSFLWYLYHRPRRQYGIRKILTK